MKLMRRSIVTLVAAIGISACGLEGEPGEDELQDGDELPAEQAEAGDPEAAAPDGTDPLLLATPTCNGVANWGGAAVPAFNGNVSCNMVRGTNSGAVRQLQRSMNVCYGEHLVLDGDFGGNTEAALRRTQAKAGTAADGQYGPNTRRAMRHESNDVPGTCLRVP